MKLITLDFETYYDQEYSLNKMPTEEYIRDPRYETIGVSVKPQGEATQWFTGSERETYAWLRRFELEKHAVCAHNMAFDGLLLAIRFGIYPAMYMDTMLMANAVIKPFTGRVSLEACLKHTGIGTKGSYVHNMIGRHRQSLSSHEMKEYAAYCVNDTETTHALLLRLLAGYPREELRIIDLTLRMYTQPQFVLDGDLLAEHLNEVRVKKEAAQQRVAATVDKDTLMSNEKFAQILISAGFEPPMKLSPSTGKPTYALAKNDLAFKEFYDQYEDHPLVGPLLVARLATKSTLEETRTDRLLNMANRQWPLRVPLSYYSAHTGRYGGTESINLQNLPQPHKSKIRFGLRAPTGCVVLGADLSQIEARWAAAFSGQRDMAEAFRGGRDVYSEFGTRLYARPISRADKRERFLSKTAVLGLQYGMGPAKFIHTARAQGDVKVDPSEAQRIVDTYRSNYTAIPRVWRTLDKVLEQMALGGEGEVGCLTYGRDYILRPSGMKLFYPNLEWDGSNYAYTYGQFVRTLWGGKVLENFIQAIARDTVMHNMVRIYDELGLRPALQVHDELDYIVPEEDAEEISQEIRHIMTAPPAYMPALPVDVEIHWGASFGDCR